MQRATASRITGPDRRVHASRPSPACRSKLERPLRRDHPLRQGASHRGRGHAHCSRTSPTTATWSRRRTGSTSSRSPRSSARERTVGCVRQLRRGLPGAGRDSLRRPRRRGGRRDRRPRSRRACERLHALLRAVRADARRDPQHLGLPLGQGSLRRDAVRDRAHQRVDRRRARRRPRTATLYIALAREMLRRRGGAQACTPEAFDGFDPGRLPPGRTGRRCGALARRRWSRTTAARPRRTAASGATSRCASGRTEVDAQLGDRRRSAAEHGRADAAHRAARRR